MLWQGQQKTDSGVFFKIGGEHTFPGGRGGLLRRPCKQMLNTGFIYSYQNQSGKWNPEVESRDSNRAFNALFKGKSAAFVLGSNDLNHERNK